MGVSCKSSVHSLPQGREFYGRRRRRSSCVKQTHSRSPQTNENRKLYKYNNFVRSEQQLVVFEKDKNRTQPQPFEKKRKGKKTVTKRLARWINPIQRNYNCWEGRRQKEYNEIGRSIDISCWYIIFLGDLVPNFLTFFGRNCLVQPRTTIRKIAVVLVSLCGKH